MIDFHCHVIPAVDDGAADPAQSLAAIDTMRAQGIGTIVATPHVSGSDTVHPARREAALAAIDLGWEELGRALAGAPAGVRLERGAEVMLDVPAPDLADPRLRLAGTSFVLVEFPFMSVPPNAAQVLFGLKMAGWTPVLAHPERYNNASESLGEAGEWRRVGAYLQVNAGSLLGRYGDRAKLLAWSLLKRGWVDYLSSDYHARGRCASAEARAALERAGAGEQARLLMETNPARLLSDQAPLRVPEVARTRPSLWGRLLGRG
jgi:protein-tyrosine phosphatase